LSIYFLYTPLPPSLDYTSNIRSIEIHKTVKKLPNGSLRIIKSEKSVHLGL